MLITYTWSQVAGCTQPCVRHFRITCVRFEYEIIPMKLNKISFQGILVQISRTSWKQSERCRVRQPAMPRKVNEKTLGLESDIIDVKPAPQSSFSFLLISWSLIDIAIFQSKRTEFGTDTTIEFMSFAGLKSKSVTTFVAQSREFHRVVLQCQNSSSGEWKKIYKTI